MAKLSTSKRDSYLRRTYDITEATYQAMLRTHDGKCWICDRKPLPGKNLNVDHEHLTKPQRKKGMKFGKVRGLLCYFCNKYLIGRRKTADAYKFRNAAEYLEEPYDWRTYAVQRPS